MVVARIESYKKPAGKAVIESQSIVKDMKLQEASEVHAAESQVTCLFTWVTMICRK